MNQQLHARLLEAGISETDADEIAKAYPITGADDGDVDVDRLTKAMEDISDTFEAPADDTTSVDDAIQEASDIVDAVTKGADALLTEQRAQYESLSKGLLALAEEVQSLRGRIAESDDTVQKSLSTVTAAVNEPMAPKAVLSA